MEPQNKQHLTVASVRALTTGGNALITSLVAEYKNKQNQQQSAPITTAELPSQIESGIDNLKKVILDSMSITLQNELTSKNEELKQLANDNALLSDTITELEKTNEDKKIIIQELKNTIEIETHKNKLELSNLNEEIQKLKVEFNMKIEFEKHKATLEIEKLNEIIQRQDKDHSAQVKNLEHSKDLEVRRLEDQIKKLVDDNKALKTRGDDGEDKNQKLYEQLQSSAEKHRQEMLVIMNKMLENTSKTTPSKTVK